LSKHSFFKNLLEKVPPQEFESKSLGRFVGFTLVLEVFDFVIKVSGTNTAVRQPHRKLGRVAWTDKPVSSRLVDVEAIGLEEIIDCPSDRFSFASFYFKIFSKFRINPLLKIPIFLIFLIKNICLFCNQPFMLAIADFFAS
jgi:hypothetical protein